GGDKGSYRKDDISLLEKLAQLVVKSSSVVPKGKLTLLEMRSSLHLVNSSFWLKAGPCLLKCEKNDLTHAIGSTFEKIISLELIGDFCHIKMELDVQKPLRRGIFILAANFKELPQDDLPFSLTLKAESNLVGKDKRWTTMKDNLGIKEVETNLDSPLSQSDLKEKDKDKIWFEDKFRCVDKDEYKDKVIYSKN
ncbi:hypothetical protein Goshw_000336, partial [Gossypium schwendimanii]|nr:hypothetical protein [Gossypium schwendimanii]